MDNAPDMLNFVDAIRNLFSDFNGGVFVGLTSLIYIVINVLRGKAGFDVPFITKAFNKIESKGLKTFIIMFLFILAGGISTVMDGFSFMEFLDGCLGGLSVGLTVLGTRHAAKATMEAESVQALKEKMKSALKKDKK